jgi:calreticulin
MGTQFLLLTLLFAAALGKIYYHETFENLDGWTEAEGKTGQFGLAKEEWGVDTESTRLKTMKDATFYAIATKIDEPLDNTDKDLVLLLNVKHEQNIDCGGGYLKLMNSLESLEKFDGDTQYEIMFGPDFCGSTRKVHAILRHEDENLLINKDVRATNDVYTHQYVFILKPDNTFDISVDGESKQSGDVKEFWDFELPKEINDPDVSKPDDWVDDPMMEDPDDKKPDDWVEDEMIVDPDAEKPEDWDDEDDGDWEAPMIPNPAYQGPWTPQEIDNPAYKGPWEHPKIPNPDFKEVHNPAHRLPINYIGFDLWQVKAGTLFGEIVLADKEEDLKAFLWDEDKHEAEKEAKKAFDKANEPPEEDLDEDEDADFEELSESEEASAEGGEEAAEKKDETEGAHDEL